MAVSAEKNVGEVVINIESLTQPDAVSSAFSSPYEKSGDEGKNSDLEVDQLSRLEYKDNCVIDIGSGVPPATSSSSSSSFSLSSSYEKNGDSGNSFFNLEVDQLSKPEQKDNCVIDIDSGVPLAPVSSGIEVVPLSKVEHWLVIKRRTKKIIYCHLFLLNLASLVVLYHLRTPVMPIQNHHLIMAFFGGINAHTLLANVKDLISDVFKDRKKEKDEKREKENAHSESSGSQGNAHDSIMYSTIVIEEIFALVSISIYLVLLPVMRETITRKTIFITTVSIVNKIFDFVNTVLNEYWEKKLDAERKQCLAQIRQTTTSPEKPENAPRTPEYGNGGRDSCHGQSDIQEEAERSDP